jgi:hypothetical protein
MLLRRYKSQRAAAGDIVAEQRIGLTSKQPATGRPMTVRPKIVVAEPGVDLRWASSLPGIIGGEHRFELGAASVARRPRHQLQWQRQAGGRPPRRVLYPAGR